MFLKKEVNDEVSAKVQGKGSGRRMENVAYRDILYDRQKRFHFMS